MHNPVEAADEAIPTGAVAGLAAVLLALGDELRKANHQVGEFSFPPTMA